ncbi:MAG: alpha-galactosidase [Thiolinea sp.]
MRSVFTSGKTSGQFWRLDSARQTLVFASDGNMPECIYWGGSLPVAEDLATLHANQQRAIGGASLDTPVPLSLCPEVIRGFIGQPGLELSTPEGKRLFADFSLQQATVSTHRLVFILRDDLLGLGMTLTVELQPESETISACSQLQLIDKTKPAIRVDWLSAPVLPVPDSVSHLLDFAGRWCGEFQPQTHQWQLGIHQRESREGRTSHAHVPLLFSGDAAMQSTRGEVYGWHFAWSGGHKMLAQELDDGRRQVQFGIIDNPRLINTANPVLETPKLYMSYSDNGLNDLMQSFHRLARQDIVRFTDSERPRPVHYNCWEAVYFEHDVATLKDIASQAAAIGAERFVLDDGWFKGRHHDRAALGDWVVDEEKYPNGLQPLIDHIHDEGMTFGLWVEPEMVNPDSDLYRAHPDWVLGPAAQPTGRQQLVLDLSKPAVSEYLFTCLNSLLNTYPIEYIKWDHNRVCLGATAVQNNAFMALLQRLSSSHPKVEIESCASGGGRIDFGILRHTQRVWLSDSNDALERWRIQHNAALLLPPEVTGSHVGPRHCHTSGRVLPMVFRAWVAASRHMGFEMDPRELDATERDILFDVTKWWKTNRDWLLTGDLYRLDSDDEAVTAEMTLAKNQQKLVVFAAQMTTSDRNNRRRLRLTGLKPETYYRLKLRNPEDMAGNMTRYWASPLVSPYGMILSGSALMKQGISLPIAFPATMWVIEGELCSGQH